MIGVSGCVNATMTQERLQAHMLKYANAKYNQEFVVEQFVGNEYWHGTDRLVLHAKGDPQQVFEVIQDSSEKGVYRDTYPLAKWSAALTARYGADALKALGDPAAPIKVYAYMPISKITAGMAEQTFDGYVSAGGKQATLIFKAAAKDASGSANTASAFKFYEYAKSAGQSFNISVGFVDDPSKYSEYVRTADVNNTAWGNLGPGVAAYVVAGSPESVSSADGLSAFYKTVRAR